MFGTIKKVLSVNRMEFVQVGGITLGAGVAGMIILFLIMGLAKAETYIYLGAFLAMLVAIMMYLMVGMLGFAVDFNQAVTMGIVRKRFLAAYYIQMTLTAIIVSAIAMGIGMVEMALYPKMPWNATLDGDFDFGAVPWVKIFLAVIILLPALRFIIGAFVIRFQKIGLWVLWALWMTLCIGGTRIIHICRDANNPIGKFSRQILDILKEWPEAALAALGVGIVFLLVAGAWFMIRKQAVTTA